MLQEIKVWTIFPTRHESKKQGSYSYLTADMMAVCEDWWSVTKDSTSLFELYKIYRDTFTRKTLRRSMILESLVVVLTAFFIQQEKVPMRDKDH